MTKRRFTMGQTVVEKIAQAHMTEGPNRPIQTGDVVTLCPRHVMTHDNTAAVLKKYESVGAGRIYNARQPVFPMDHDIQNTSEANLNKYRKIQAFAERNDIDFYPPGTGISHQVMVSMGYVVPGALVVGSDSHSNMYGALGALGTPVVRTDAAAIWATGVFWWQIPNTIKVVLDGRLTEGVTGKDVIITLCGLYNRGEVLNAALEFSGPGIKELSMDARFSIANMTTEWGALTGWFPVDDVTMDYLRGRKSALETQGVNRFTENDLERWASDPPRPDADASYAGRVKLDLGQVRPHVAGPDTVQTMTSVAEIEKAKVTIQKAYLVSCVNSRLEDLEAAAKAIEGQKVAAGVDFYVAAASREVQESAERSGAWKTLLDAGAEPLPPGCGPCIGLGKGLLEPGEVGISATNRNFKGRMGSREARVYLASPEVVAASAAAGFITSPRVFEQKTLTKRYLSFDVDITSEEVEILDGFPGFMRGRLVFVPQDNLNTDGIYGKDYTYREDMTPADMARVVMENYDPEFAGRTSEGDILVGGFNFGTGSSREQAATALQARGITLVIAGSFSQTFLRNAYNNGLICIDCSSLVTMLKEIFLSSIKHGDTTLIPGDLLEIDFSHGRISFRGQNYQSKPLGSVPQSLVIAGGIENLVRIQISTVL